MAALQFGAAAFTAEEGLETDTRIFDFLLSPFDHEMTSAVDYAQRTVLTESFVIPGSQPPATTSRGRTHSLVFFRRWFGLVRTMHQSGYSLRGNFTATNCMINAKALRVKMNAVHLYPYSRDHGSMDYTSLVRSMEEILLLRELVPPHLRQWFDLISEGINGYEELIRYHFSLMEPKQAFDFLLEARVMLEQLRGVNPQKFPEILLWHRPLDNWDFHSYCVNTYMEAARTYCDPRTGKKIEFAHDFTGVLTLGRHCCVHHAKFLKAFMVFIFEDDFPEFMSRFQLIIFRAGLLPSFNLEVTMA